MYCLNRKSSSLRALWSKAQTGKSLYRLTQSLCSQVLRLFDHLISLGNAGAPNLERGFGDLPACRHQSPLPQAEICLTFNIGEERDRSPHSAKDWMTIGVPLVRSAWLGRGVLSI